MRVENTEPPSALSVQRYWDSGDFHQPSRIDGCSTDFIGMMSRAFKLLSTARAWGFDGDGHLFRLVSEAHRICLPHLFDPVLADLEKQSSFLCTTAPPDSGSRYVSKRSSPIGQK